MKIGCQHKFSVRRHPQRNTKIETSKHVLIAWIILLDLIEKWMIKNEVKLLQYYVGDIFGKGHYLVD